MKELFVVVSTLVALAFPVVYSIAILKGEARPHRTTRFVFLLITAISTISLVMQGSSAAVWLAAAEMFGSVIIFVLSIKFGAGGWAKGDILALVIALIGIVIWQTTNMTIIGLVFALVADFSGIVPTFIKVYKDPFSEVYLPFLLSSIAAFLSILGMT